MSVLSLISPSSPKQLGMVSPELPSSFFAEKRTDTNNPDTNNPGHRDVSAELWAPVAECVKLAPFAAGIDAWGAVLQSGQSGFAPCCGWQEWRTSDHSGLGWTDECRPIIG
jgi:hypothetical protein